MSAIAINGQSHSWSNLVVNIAGVVVTRITNITYKETQTIENIYGAGQYPVSRGFGKIEPSASITLLLGEVEAIRAACPTGRLQDIAPFDIIVQFVPENQKIVTHRIRNAQFKDEGVVVTQNNSPVAITLNLIVSKIEWK